MPAIHENLKNLRNTCRLSQADVAEAINVTRQTVSSYETGRTQPDLETLSRLAALYNTDLHDVLYGSSQLQRKMKQLRRFAVALSAMLLLILLVHSFLLWYMNTAYAIEGSPGYNPRISITLTDENREFFDRRFELRDTASHIARIGPSLFSAGCLVFLYPLITIKKSPPLRIRVAWLLGLAAAAYAVVLPFMLNDEMYGRGDYLFPLWHAQQPMILLFLASLVVDAVRRLRVKIGKAH